MATVTLGNMEEGSIIKIMEKDTLVDFYVAKHNYESKLNGTGRTLMVRKYIKLRHQWHSSDVNAYATSDVDAWLNNDYKQLFSEDISSAMGTTIIYYTPSRTDQTVTTLSRSAFLLSCKELGGYCTPGHINEEGTTLPIASTLKSSSENGLSGSDATQMTRTPKKSSNSVVGFNVNGSNDDYGCTFRGGIRPAFTLPSSIYVSDDGSVLTNTAPTMPDSIDVPENVQGGTNLDISWGASTDQDNNMAGYELAGYELERQVDGGEWTQVYKGEATSYTDAITRGWLTVNYRVRAYDSYGATSDYTTGTAREVNNNRAPSITCTSASGSDLGTKTEGFSVSYSAADADGDPVTVTEAIDGVTLRTFTPEGEGACTCAVTGETWMKILNGAHELTITASDGQAQSVHTLAFTKSVTAASVTLAQPMEADGPITLCVLSVTGSIPEDADYSVKVTNNALDDAPVWEDCTDEVKLGANHVFTNETAANGFAFNFKVEVERGESGQGGYINSVQGGFQ